MDICTNCAGNLVSKVCGYMFLQMKGGVGYVFHYKRRVENFEKKVETLKERRDRVRLDVDAAKRNVQEIHSDVNSWLSKADKVIHEEVKQVKDLEGKANNKCLISLCPNFKLRYQLSKKAEEDTSVVDELLQQGEFDKVSYSNVPQAIADAPPRDFEAFDSRKKVFDEIMEALKDPNINIVGVYGMPGVGKTTLVKEVARQVRQDKSFDSVVIAAVTQTPDIIKIQDQVAELLGLKLEEKSVAVRAIRLHQTLKAKKSLVVLDNVWTRLDLKEVGIPIGDVDQECTRLGIPIGDVHKGCTILVTSRDVHVLQNKMDAQKSFPVGILKEDEAWNLFKKMAGNSLENPDLQSIAIQIAKRCAGLPIAISTVARALRNKALFEWRDALLQLQRPSPSNFKGVPGDAYSAIEFSYARLESEELKQTFLLCSLLPHNVPILVLLKYSMGLGLFQGVSTIDQTWDRLLTLVSHLKSSCLLLDSYNNLRFDMHDLVRDVAISIASKDNHVFALREDVLIDWPDGETMKNCDKISLLEVGISKLPEQLKYPKLTFFFMFSKDPSMKMPPNLFEEMKNLKVLDLTNMHFPSLPSSICLLTNLRTLCLELCVLGDIAIIGELKNLETLSLVESDIEMLPKEMGQLSKLKLLDLSDCTKLRIIPPGVFSSLSRLEELRMGNSFVQWEEDGRNNASLAEFKAFSDCLTAVEVQIPNAKIIPKDFFFGKLKRYKIFIGEAWDWDGRIEESRTLKLELQTSTRYLNAGVNMLMDNAENVHLDERTGVEILPLELEDWKRLRKLKNLHVQNGPMLKYIIKHDDVIDKIEFPQLQSLTLQDLPKLISFNSKNNGSNSICPQELPLFSEKIVVPKLEKLKLSSINIERIWDYQLPKGSTSSMRNLTSLIIEGCANLKYILSPSMVNCLQQLQVFEISACNRIREVISIEEIMTEDANRATFSFPRLKILKIEQCPELKGFINKSMSKDITAGSTTEAVLFNEEVGYRGLKHLNFSKIPELVDRWNRNPQEILEFKSLEFLEVCNSSNLKCILNISMVSSLGRLQQLEIKGCNNLEAIIKEEEAVTKTTDDKSIILPLLTSIIIEACSDLRSFYWGSLSLVEFPSLAKIEVSNCPNMTSFASTFSIGEDKQAIIGDGTEGNNDDLTALFCHKVALPRLERLIIKCMGSLKKIWHHQLAGESFCSLNFLWVKECERLLNVFPLDMVGRLQKLDFIVIQQCGSIEAIFEGQGPTASAVETDISFVFPKVTYLKLYRLGKLKCFFPGRHTTEWPSLKEMWVYGCDDIEIFASESLSLEESTKQQPLFWINEATFRNLEELKLEWNDIMKGIWHGQLQPKFFCKLKVIELIKFIRQSAALPQCFFQSLPNLEKLVVNDAPFTHIFQCEEEGYGYPLCELRLTKLPELMHIWKEDCQSGVAFSNLKSIEVRECGYLKNLMPSFMFFANLTTLQVSECHGFMNLMSSSMAKSLAQLTKMIVSDCKMIEEIIALEGDEVKGGIVFNHLRFLQLSCLLRLKSFFLGDHIIEFPALEELIVNGCPRMEIFCRGDLSTPKLYRVQLTDDEDGENRQWEGNLTIQQMFKERVGCSGLKHLKFSEILELVDIWNINAQEMKFRNLEFLEVCDSNNLKFILNLSMASSLSRLRQLEIKRCNNLEAVVNEIELAAKTKTTDDKSIIFPLLTSITIESCPDLTSFYWGSPSLIEFPALERIEISHCANMTSFVSPFSRDEEKQVICCVGTEGNNANDLTALFCYKVALPRLERLIIKGMGSLKKIWHHQLAGESFCSLNYLWVEECERLLNVFPLDMVGRLQKLDIMVIQQCGSIEGIFEGQGPTASAVETDISFVFPKVTFLKLYWLGKLKCFFLGRHTTEWPTLKQMWVYGCDNIEIFASESLNLGESSNQQPLFWINEATFPNLEELKLEWNDIMKEIWHGQLQPKFFYKLKVVELIKFIRQSAALPQCFFQSLPNLEKLVVNDAPFTHIFQCEEEGYGSPLCELRLTKLPELMHIWKEDCQSSAAFSNLKSIEVRECGDLKNLMPSSMFFANLTTLQVSECHGFMNLMSSSTAKSLTQLTKMIVGDCKRIEEIIALEGDEVKGGIVFNHLRFLQLSCLLRLKGFSLGDHIIEFPALEKLIVNGCPRMDMFCRGNLSTPKLHQVQLTDDEGGENRQWEGNLTIQQMFEERVGCSGLKHLKFSEILELVDIWNINAQEVKFKNLEFLELCDSNNLKFILNLSMASSLSRLRQLEIKRCNNLEAVVNELELAAKTKTTDDKSIIFPHLTSITIESCPDLTSFYWGSPSLIEFPALERIQISHCANMTSFVSSFSRDEEKQVVCGVGTEGNNANDLTAFFCYKAAFPKLEEMAISHLRNVKRIWYDDQLHVDSFCNLKKLKVECCDQLLNIFPSHMLGVFPRLETLILTDCGSLEDVFGIKDTCVTVAMQLRTLRLIRLPKLKSVLPFPIAKGLLQLETLDVDTCGVEEIVSKNSEGLERETLFEFNRLSYLALWNLPDLERFYSGRHTTAWPVLKKLWTRGSKKIKIFGQPQSQSEIQQPLFLINEVIPQLEEVTFSSDDISMICDDQFATDFFCHIKKLGVTSYLTESAVFPFGFLQRFYNLEWLGVYNCNFRDLSLCKGYGNGGEKQEWRLPKVRHLRLRDLYKIEHLWDEDSPLDHICANLEALDVYYCDSLISLGSSSSASFQNLTTLDVWKCNGIVELITSSKAQGFQRLVTMKIKDCEMMKEVVASEGDDEATQEITFRKLEYLELHCLQSLKSFCSGNYTFKFPSLERVTVSECPSLKSFSQGALSTPKLRRVQLRKTDSTEHWIGDLNATIEQIARLSE